MSFSAAHAPTATASSPMYGCAAPVNSPAECTSMTLTSKCLISHIRSSMSVMISFGMSLLLLFCICAAPYWFVLDYGYLT